MGSLGYYYIVVV
jgi:hypothetical protein